MGLVEKAREFSKEKHRNQYRKGNKEPYHTHLERVATILKKNGANNEVIAAGYLHDIVEDQDVTEAEIRKKFGNYIADLVMSVTERDKSLPWRVRKENAINNLKEFSREQEMIKCADKLSNLEDTINAHSIVGDKVWEKFKAGREDQAFVYKSVLDNFTKITDLPMYKDYKNAVEKMFGKKTQKFI